MGMDESSNAMMWRPSFTAWDGISTRRSSPAFRRLYAQQRDNIDTIIITTTEPYIPWELAKPHENGLDGEAPYEEDFLCVRHSMMAVRRIAAAADVPCPARRYHQR